MKRACMAACAALLVALSGASAARADGSVHFNPPKHYYLALGDSLAFGFQGAKFQQELIHGTYDPASFNTGYVDDFGQMMKSVRPTIQTVNYSCSGETTGTFINGGCPLHSASLPLHNDYPVTISQLTAALAFLHAHTGKVSPITINLGANDLSALTSKCAGSSSCLGTGLAGIAANYTTILTAIRAASPSSEILVLNNVDPYQFAAPASVPLFGALNAITANVAATQDAQLVDIFTPALGFTPTYFCSLTFVCAPPLYDVHPTDTGYSLIAQYIWAASGYADLEN